MKIFYDFKEKHIMIQRMEPVWKKLGHSFSTTPEGCDVQLSVVKVNRHTGLPIVLRLDGVYYDSETDYNKRNAIIGKAHSIADSVIYQSGYGKRLCEEYLSPRKLDSFYSIIPNGIERDWSTQVSHEGMNIVVVSKWRRHKRLQEITELFLEFMKKCSHTKLHVIGDLCENVPVEHPQIVYYGELTYEQMKHVDKKADLHIHLSKRDNCPNTVLEAVGAGVPVITTDLCGGAVEICSNYENGIVCPEGRITFNPVPCYTDDYNHLPRGTKRELLTFMGSLYRKPGKGAFPEEYEISNVAKRYLGVMEKTAELKSKDREDRKQLHIWNDEKKIQCLHTHWGKYEDTGQDPLRKEFIDVLKEKINIVGNNASVLEVGSGLGHNLWAVKDMAIIEGVDWELPYGDSSHDIVIQMDVCLHVGGSWESILEMIRVARRYIVFTGPSFEDFSDKMDKPIKHKLSWGVSQPLLDGSLDELKREGKIKDYYYLPRPPHGKIKHRILVIEKSEKEKASKVYCSYFDNTYFHWAPLLAKSIRMNDPDALIHFHGVNLSEEQVDVLQGLRVDIVAQEHTIPGLVEAMERYFERSCSAP